MKVINTIVSAAAALLLATGAQAQATIDVSQAITGGFAVSAADTVGTAVHNGGDQTLYVTFCPMGRWSYANDTSFVPSCGTNFNQPQRLLFPNLLLGELAITRDGIRGGKVEPSDEFTLAPNETVFLLMNDVPGHYTDNQGALQISYTASSSPTH